MSTTKKTTSTQSRQSAIPARPVPAVSQPRRRLRLPAYKLFRLKRITHPVQLPSVWWLTARTARTLWQHRWLFLGIGGIYAALNILFVRGFSGAADIGGLQTQLGQGIKGNAGQLLGGISSLTTLLAASGNGTSTTAGVYQLVLWLVGSLALIWALRQVTAGEPAGLKDPFYKGMYPLVPFVLVIGVVVLQTVPFLLGAAAYNYAVSYGIAIGWSEQLLWGGFFLALTLISVYMLCSSLFAVYIVTLPDMTPLKALRSARKLVQYRRSVVFRKLAFLLLALLVLAAAIMLPVVLWLSAVAAWVFFLVGMLALIIVHAYMYTLYRELLI